MLVTGRKIEGGDAMSVVTLDPIAKCRITHDDPCPACGEFAGTLAPWGPRGQYWLDCLCGYRRQRLTRVEVFELIREMRAATPRRPLHGHHLPAA
jgi:hypothetical protein